MNFMILFLLILVLLFFFSSHSFLISASIFIYVFFSISEKLSKNSHLLISFFHFKSKHTITSKHHYFQSFSFNVTFILGFLFISVIIFNLMGLNVFFDQMFIGKMSFSLLFLSISFWLSSYIPFFFKEKEKISIFLVGEMGFPSLSFLLSNIEILTQFFRPITLTARLWVNIWVGHLLLSALSSACFFTLNNMNNFIMCLISLMGFFLFETGIMTLQAFVFSYLIGVYWEENLEHANVSI